VKDPTYRIVALAIGNGLATSEGERWKSHRRILTPAFHFQFLKLLFGTITLQCQELLRQLEASPVQPIKAYDFFSHHTLSIIIKASVGEGVAVSDLGASYQKIMSYLEPVFIGELLLGPLLQYLPLPFMFNLRTSRAELNKIILEAIARKRKQLAEEGREQLSEEEYKKAKGKTDFLTLMIQSGELSDEEILDEACTFFFAGHDTSSSILSWSMYFLAKYPEEQKKIQEELDRKGFDLETLTPEKLETFSRLKMFTMEALRVRPPVLFLSRELAQDKEFRGHLLPKGTLLNILVQSIHHHPDYWTRPEEFRPERFDPESEENNQRHPYAYFPFSAGPRICIGKRLALQEIQVIIGTLLSKFSVEGKTEGVIIDGKVLSKPKDYHATFVPRK